MRFTSYFHHRKEVIKAQKPRVIFSSTMVIFILNFFFPFFQITLSLDFVIFFPPSSYSSFYLIFFLSFSSACVSHLLLLSSPLTHSSSALFQPFHLCVILMLLVLFTWRIMKQCLCCDGGAHFFFVVWIKQCLQS